MQLKVKVLAFGIVKDIFGSSEIETGMVGKTVEELKKKLEQEYPRLKSLSSFMIALNNEYACGNEIIKEGDEIAIIPPVSGG